MRGYKKVDEARYQRIKTITNLFSPHSQGQGQAAEALEVSSATWNMIKRSKDFEDYRQIQQQRSTDKTQVAKVESDIESELRQIRLTLEEIRKALDVNEIMEVLDVRHN
jgi:hypothetical protein